ncbi:MAG: glutamate 5-kinase [Bacilli bacterium]|nr:glutamate 5-kinase [Bacilli bacterium]
MRDYKNIKRIIIKIGSSSLVNGDKSINENKIAELIGKIASLMKLEKEVVLVTSGAIAIGMNKLGLSSKPKSIPLKQACASLGQVSLMETYERYANIAGFLCAQILVNHDDFENRNRMLNLGNTLETLFQKHILPIINENDALAVEEIKVGDNDTLAALLVPMVKADLLILISDVDGLYDKNPQDYKDAKLIDFVENIDDDIEKMIDEKNSSVGTGGMTTKIKAARIATSSGCHMAIINSSKLDNIIGIINGENVGTWFAGNKVRMKSREHWIIYKTYAKGIVIVDAGAVLAIQKRKSLLPGGVIDVDGNFLAESVVFIRDTEGNNIAKGIVNYSSDEIKIIKGKKTTDILPSLGYKLKDEIIHANNLVIIEGEKYGIIK